MQWSLASIRVLEPAHDPAAAPRRHPSPVGPAVVQAAGLETPGPRRPLAWQPAPRVQENLGAGAALTEPLATRYGQAFGMDLRRVRVHRDVPDLGATALAVGQHVAFAPGAYQPGTAKGDHLLAHELAHVVQQGGGAPGAGVATVQAHGGDGGAHEAEAEAAATAIQRGHALPTLSPVTGPAVQGFDLDRAREFASDIIASVTEAPSHALEVLGEVWSAIREHWVTFSAVLIAMLTVEAVIAALAGAPEPTTITKWVAAALQVLMTLILGYFVSVELGQVTTWATRWVNTAWDARGNPERITAASVAFCHMLLHMALLILSLVGARTRMNGVGGTAGAMRTGSRVGSTSAATSEGTMLRIGAGGRSMVPAEGPVVGEGLTVTVPPAPTVTPPGAVLTTSNPVGAATSRALATSTTRRYGERQTCSDGRLDELQEAMHNVCDRIPGESCSPSKVSPKRLARRTCADIVARITAQRACLALREQIQSECFGNEPDAVHAEQIESMRSGLRHCITLAGSNCTEDERRAAGL